jgi:hypothetical protein
MSRGGIEDDYNILVGLPDEFPNTILAAQILKPERPDTPTRNVYYATQSITHLTRAYENRLKRATPISAKLDDGLSSVTITIINADLDQRSEVYPYPDRYIGSFLTLYHILEAEDQGGYLTIFEGICVAIRYSEMSIDLDFVAETNRSKNLTLRTVGHKCPWEFKGAECGYSGAETVCNKLYTDAGGCSGRSNQHRFGGFPGRPDVAAIGKYSGLGASPSYQLLQSGDSIVTQRVTTSFDDTFSVADDSANNRTVVSSITPDWVNVRAPKYKAAASLTTTTGTIASGSSSLVVANASGWEVGHGVRVIGAGTVAGTSTLNGAINSSVTTITLASTANFDEYGMARIGSEIVYYYGKTSTQLQNVSRAYEGTSAASHLNGATVTPYEDLVTTVTAISGTTLTLAAAAGTTATGRTVYHDDTYAIGEALNDALTGIRPLYLGSGSYYSGPIIIDGEDPVTILGDGPGRSTIYSIHPTPAIIVDTATGSSGTILFQDLGFYGAGGGAVNHGLRFRDTGANGIYGVTLRNLKLENFGGSGVKMESGTYATSTILIESVDVDQSVYAIGDAFDLWGAKDLTLLRCQVRFVPDGKSGYRVRSGSPVFIGCTGISSGTDTRWATLGNNVTDDGVASYVKASLIGCSVAEFSGIGVHCKSESVASFYSTTISPSTTGTLRALKFDYVTADQAGIFDAQSTIDTGGRTFTNSQPIHSYNAPFVQIGHREFTQYYDTNVSTAVSFPAIRTTSIGSGATIQQATTLAGYSRVSGHTLYDEQSTPGTPPSNTGYLYAKDIGGVTGLYWKADGVAERRIDTQTSSGSASGDRAYAWFIS